MGSGTMTAVSGAPGGGGIVTDPAFEPVTLAELKLHLRVDSGSFADNIDTSQSLVPDNYAIAADYTTHVGTGVDVLGYTALVNLNSGAYTATGTVDCKIQESDDDVTYVDWSGGAFTQVEQGVNDEAIQEIAYTGTKQYIRTVAQVLLATCDFGTTVIRLTATTIEDDLLNADITAAREYAEDVTRRAIITQTWDFFLDDWPDGNSFEVPKGNLQTGGLILSYDYVDTDGTKATTTMDLTDDYLIETNGEQLGRIVLPYSGTWPSFTKWPVQPIRLRYVCGWTTRALVPNKIKQAILMYCGDLYANRESQVLGIINEAFSENVTVDRLLASMRLWM